MNEDLTFDWEKRGGSLLESLLAVAVFAIGIGTVIHLLLGSYSASVHSIEKSQALFLAKEGIEAVRSIKSDDFSNLSEIADYGVEVTTSGVWEFKATPDVIDDFTRKISLQTVDDETWEVTVSVTWSPPRREEDEIVVTEYLTKWQEPFDFGDPCLSFETVDDYIALPNDLGYTTTFSAFAWFRADGDAGGGYHPIMGGEELEISVENTTGAIRTGLYTDSSFSSSHTTGVSDGTWHHIGFTFDGSTKESYVDGVSVGSLGSITGTLTASFSSRNIGKYGSSSTYWTDGVIKGVRIYDRVLDSDEIGILFNEGNISSGLVGYWLINEGEGSIAEDDSGNGNDGTINGGTWLDGEYCR